MDCDCGGRDRDRGRVRGGGAGSAREPQLLSLSLGDTERLLSLSLPLLLLLLLLVTTLRAEHPLTAAEREMERGSERLEEDTLQGLRACGAAARERKGGMQSAPLSLSHSVRVAFGSTGAVTEASDLTPIMEPEKGPGWGPLDRGRARARGDELPNREEKETL